MSKKICIVFDHPYTADAYNNEPHNRSFSAALLHAVMQTYNEKGFDVDIIDLHKEQFDPVMHKEDLIAWRGKSVIDAQAKDYQDRILCADEIMFIFPIWWEVMPAMTKGFFDKVLSKGIVYEEKAGKSIFQNNFIRLKKVHLVTTMATPNMFYRFLFGNPISKVVFRGTFRKMGINNLKWHNFSNMQKFTYEERKNKVSSFQGKLNKAK